MSLTLECTKECAAMPECTECHQRKKPHGRDAPGSSVYCDFACHGYLEHPRSGHLWPEEWRDRLDPA
jgi:hypothetical protein